MNLLLSEAIMSVLPETDSNLHKNIQTRPQIRSIFGGTKFACVYLEIKPNQLSKGAPHRKMMQYLI